jgi:hypothetical protein
VAVLVQDLGLHALERGEVPILLRGRVDGVDAPVLVPALVLEVDDVPVVLGPEKEPDAALAVVGDRLEPVAVDGGADGPTQTFRTPSFGARKARLSPSGRGAGSPC